MNVSEAMAASIGGAVSASILYPVDVITKKMQLSPPQQSNIRNDDDTINNNDTNQTTLSKQYSFYNNNNNKTSLFRGIEIAALQSAIEKYCYVISYNCLQRIHTTWLSTSNKSSNNFYMNVLYGYISQWVHLPITIPLDVWKTHIQLVSMNNDTNHTNQWKILYNMIKDPNVQFYKGLSTYIIICWKPAIQYTIYEYLKRKLITYNYRKNNNTTESINSNNPSTKQHYHPISWKESILLALISRTIATILIYPHIRAKLQLQVQSSSSSSSSSSSLSTTNTVTNIKHEQECKQIQFEQQQQQQDDGTDQTKPTNSIQDAFMTSSYNGSKTSLLTTTNTKGVITYLLQILNIPHYIDSIYTKNNDITMRILRQYFDIITYYYKGIGPELIRGGISAIISYLIQEYIRIKTK